MRNQLFTALKVSALALALSFGMSYALAWTAPSTTPPGGNVAAPINTSGTAQTKTGAFTISATTTTSTLIAGGLGVIADSLTTNGITFGDGTIQSTAPKIVAGPGVSISPSGGTGAVTVTNTYPVSCSASFSPTPAAVSCGLNGTGVTFNCSGGRLISVTTYTYGGTCASG